MERYSSESALKAHGSSDKFKEFGKLLKQQKLAAITSVDVYPEVQGVGYTSKL